ncbi:MAG: hypothetical protein HYZ45_00885 [Burkholderiales bacterium]|nr:hypothetical protein [Burkholderiales bacterium]
MNASAPSLQVRLQLAAAPEPVAPVVALPTPAHIAPSASAPKQTTPHISAPTQPTRATPNIISRLPSQAAPASSFSVSTDNSADIPTRDTSDKPLDLADIRKNCIGKIDRDLRGEDKLARPNTIAALANKAESGHQLERAIAAAGIQREIKIQELVAADGRRYSKFTSAAGTYCMWPKTQSDTGTKDSLITNCP